MNSKKFVIYILFAALAVSLIGLGIFWYVNKEQEMRAAERMKEYNKADELHHEGKFDESILAFSNLLNEPTTISLETKTKFKLAFDLFSRNQGDDRQKAATILKEIIKNEEVSRFQRAWAINDFLDWYQGTQNKTIARELIFDGEPLEKFYVESSGDIELSLRKTYEFSVSLFPTPLATFRVARWYGNKLTEEGGTLSKEIRDEYINQLKTWSGRGGMTVQQMGIYQYENNKIGYIYQMKAMTDADVARFSSGDYSAAEESFKMGLAALSPEDDLHSYGLGLFLRFHYASVLARVYGKERIGDINEILQTIVNRPAQFSKSYFFFDDFLKNELGSEHDEHGHKKDMVLLAKLVPKFNSFLLSKGINLND